jgi:hypothetical protein
MNTTLRTILDSYPSLEAAFWRYAAAHSTRNLETAIIEAWEEGGFDAEWLANEIEAEITFLARD